MDSQLLEQALRKELRRHHNVRWSSEFKTMKDEERLRVLGQFAARRLYGEEVEIQCKQHSRSEPAESPRQLSGELQETQGSLQNDAGGGRRVIRSAKPMT